MNPFQVGFCDHVFNLNGVDFPLTNQAKVHEAADALFEGAKSYSRKDYDRVTTSLLKSLQNGIEGRADNLGKILTYQQNHMATVPFLSCRALGVAAMTLALAGQGLMAGILTRTIYEIEESSPLSQPQPPPVMPRRLLINLGYNYKQEFFMLNEGVFSMTGMEAIQNAIYQLLDAMDALTRRGVSLMTTYRPEPALLNSNITSIAQQGKRLMDEHLKRNGDCAPSTYVVAATMLAAAGVAQAAGIDLRMLRAFEEKLKPEFPLFSNTLFSNN